MAGGAGHRDQLTTLAARSGALAACAYTTYCPARLVLGSPASVASERRVRAAAPRAAVRSRLTQTEVTAQDAGLPKREASQECEREPGDDVEPVVVARGDHREPDPEGPCQ